MSRSRPIYVRQDTSAMGVGTWIIYALAMIIGGIVMIAVTLPPRMTAPDTVSDSATILDSIPHCTREDGSSVPMEGNADEQGYPCQWDARVDGNRAYGPGTPPVILYYRADEMRCPVPNDPQVWCYDIMTEWGGWG